MFGKRTTPVPTPSRPAPDRPAAGKLSTIIVPRTAVEQASDPATARKLVAAVIRYVNAMTSEGLYNRLELPAKAVQAFHADYYVAQVNNGGHNQFIDNSGDNLKHCLVDIPTALAAMGADAHQAIFERMKIWLTQFPDAAQLKAALGGEASAPLRQLDKSFYEVEKTSPVSTHAARWIASWPELKVAEDADYPEAIRQVAMMNPLREARLAWRAVKRLEHAMTDRLQVANALACVNIRPPDGSVEFLVKVGGGVTMDIDGTPQLAWHVATNKGRRICVVADAYVAAYECIEPKNPPMPTVGDPEGALAAIKDGRFKNFQGPMAGRRLSQVPIKLVVDVVDLARSYNAPAALDLLLRQAGIGSGNVLVTPTKVEAGALGVIAHWFVVIDQKGFLMESGAKGSALIGISDRQCAATARRQEIDEHAAKAEAGSFAVE